MSHVAVESMCMLGRQIPCCVTMQHELVQVSTCPHSDWIHAAQIPSFKECERVLAGRLVAEWQLATFLSVGNGSADVPWVSQ